MTKVKEIVILINLGFLLIFFNRSVFQKEATLVTGKLLLLELAPIDPRSLMQGDYMQLRYKISEGINRDSIAKRGYVVVRPQDNGIAEYRRIQKDSSPLNESEILIKYTLGQWSINIGAESYFFQEGQTEKYEKAKYGGIKVDDSGNSVLVGLYDETQALIQ